MNALTNIQFINDAAGQPAFVVMPISEYMSLTNLAPVGDVLIPADVVNLAFDNNWTQVRAWREHLNISQAEIAKKLGISQSTYSEQENSQKLRKGTKQKIADVLGIDVKMLDF